jgi:hypothetical protein
MNYSLLIIGDSKVDGDGSEVDGDSETAMETDGDGSGGTSLSRQGGRTETYVPQNLSVAVVELRNSFWKIADSSKVFCPEASYRRRGIVRSGPRPPHT